MKEILRNRTLPAVVFMLSALFLSGCAAALPPYQGDAGHKATGMTHYKKNGVDLMLPQGWVETQIPAGHQKELKAKFKKGSSNLTVLCFGAFVNNNSLQAIMQGAIDPRSKIKKGPFQLADSPGFHKTGFGLYSIPVVNEGNEYWVDAWLAWKGDSGMSCKYGIIAAGYELNDLKNALTTSLIAELSGNIRAVSEEEFLAILRSVR